MEERKRGRRFKKKDMNLLVKGFPEELNNHLKEMALKYNATKRVVVISAVVEYINSVLKEDGKMLGCGLKGFKIKERY